MRNLKRVYFILFIGCISLYTSAQSTVIEKEYFELFDALTDTRNSNLANGIEYSEKYLTKKGNHKYYNTSNFLLGSIVYDNQLYNDVLLQYDTFADELIIKLYKGEAFRKIQLVKNKVSEFTLNGKRFVRISKPRLNSFSKKSDGFYEEITSNGKLTFHRRHFKAKKVELGQGVVYNSFKENTSYFVQYGTKFKEVKNKGSLIQLIPEHRKMINTFYAKNRNLEKNNFDTFLKMLATQLNKAII